MINGINYKDFFEKFKQTEIGKQLTADFDEVTCSNKNPPSILVVKNKYNTTCRELLGRNDLSIKKPYTTISAVSFYYINMLLEKNPSIIYDFGCGWNLWKKYIPIIHGVDNNSDNADEIADFNRKYISKYYRSIPSAFMINMDFGIGGENTTFENIGDHIIEFSKIIQSGGRGYFATSGYGLLYFTPDEWFKTHSITRYEHWKIAEILKQQICSLDLDIISLDIELDVLLNPPGHDGEFRLVFEVRNES